MKIVTFKYDDLKNQQRNVIRAIASSGKTHGRFSHTAVSAARGYPRFEGRCSGREKRCKTLGRQNRSYGSTLTSGGKRYRRYKNDLEFAFSGRNSGHERSNLSGSGIFYQFHRIIGFGVNRRPFIFLVPLIFSFVISGCGNAIASDEPISSQTAKPLTRAECLGMKDKADKISCFQKLAKQRKAEIKGKKARLQTTETNIEKIEKENEALLKEFERGVLDDE